MRAQTAPDFTGHALCDPGSYVQGIGDPAPFHPTAAGELAIALADEEALQQAGTSPGATPALTPSATPAAPGTSGTPATHATPARLRSPRPTGPQATPRSSP